MIADFFSAALACLVFAISLRIAMCLVFGAQQPNAIYLLFDILCRIMFTASLVFIFIVLFSTSWITWILFPFLLESILLYFATGRRVRRDSLLNLLALSTEKNLPLGELVQVWQKSHFGFTGSDETELVQLLAAGTPVSTALATVPTALPGTTSVFARAGALSGNIGPAFRAAAEQEAQGFALHKRLRDLSAYLVLAPPFILLILSFYMIKLIPAFRKIFYDFGMELPLLTEILISASDGAVTVLSVLFLPLVLLNLYLLWIIFGEKVRVRWTYLFQPGVRAVNRAAVLKLLATVVRQEQPMQPALALLAKDHPHRAMRKSIRRALRDMEQGNDWCDSLRSVNIIGKSDAALLHSAQRMGNLAWALEQTADSITRRAVQRQEAIAKILFPLQVILFGIFVGFLVIALFLPLVKLIHGLA